MNLKTLRCNSCQKTFSSSLEITCFNFLFICPTCGNGIAEILLRKRLAGQTGIEITRMIKENKSWDKIYTIIIKENDHDKVT